MAAEWSGHIDMDLLAWKELQLAKMYGNALLVIESNTLETNKVKGNIQSLYLMKSQNIMIIYFLAHLLIKYCQDFLFVGVFIRTNLARK